MNKTDYINVITPIGIRPMPISDDYKNKTDDELIAILKEQNKQFVDPVLVQIIINKDLMYKFYAGDEYEKRKN